MGIEANREISKSRSHTLEHLLIPTQLAPDKIFLAADIDLVHDDEEQKDRHPIHFEST